MEKKGQDESSKEAFKLHVSSQRIRMSKTNTREKICNDQQKIKSTSKLPRIVRMPTRYYKPIENSTKLNDDSGDSLAGPSKLDGVPLKMKKDDIIPVRLKISHIPRLKSQKEGSKENNLPLNKSRTSNHPQSNHYIPECRNVQRVNLLINPEFCPDDRGPPASVQATRPIPTLGQIYGHMNMIESDRLNDWFMEMRTPINSIRSSNSRTTTFNSGSNAFNTSSSTYAYPANSHQEDLQKKSTIVIQGQDTKKNLSSQSKSTNDNIGVWLCPDVELPTRELPTRDNKSGIAIKIMSLNNTQKSQTLSLKNSQKSMNLKKSQEAQIEEHMKMSTNQTYCIGLSKDVGPKSSMRKSAVECSTATSSILSRPTVVLCGTPDLKRVEEGTFTSKSYVSSKSSQLSKTDANNNTCSSNANQPVVTPVPRMPVPSYTDCLSEVLQKTTNFEVYQGIELSKTPSNEGTDAEIGDKPSVNGTRDATEECDVDDSTTLECSLTKTSKSSDDTTLLKSDPTVTEWSCRYQSTHSSEYTCRDSFGREFKRYCCDSRYHDLRERYKNCHRFKKFPSTRYRYISNGPTYYLVSPTYPKYSVPRTFGSWRSGGSIRRLCCRRFNHVWKKTTERWAVWSTRSHAKSRMFRKMFVQNFVRSVVWEDVNIQTNILVCNETGTGGALMEQKSAALSTMFNIGTLQTLTNLTDSGSKASNKCRHVNSGPSMFPFFLNPNGKSSNIMTADINLSGFQFPNCQQNQCTSFNNNFAWNTDAAMGISKSTKSCQYEVDIAEYVAQTTSFPDEMEVNLTDQLTDPPNFTTDEKTSIPSQAQAPILFSSHQMQTSKDICKFDAVSQNADTADLPNFMTDEKTSIPSQEQTPILFSTHQIQTNKEFDAVSQNADTADLPNFMTDVKTSVPASLLAPILFSSHQMQTSKCSGNMDAVTQNSDIEDQPYFKIEEKTSTPVSRPILYGSHHIQTCNKDVCKMEADIQNADNQDLGIFKIDEKTSMPAPKSAPILFCTNQIHTNKDVCKMDADSQSADTQDLLNFMSNDKTSIFSPMPIQFIRNQIQTNKDAGNMNSAALAQNVITCHNAEAGMIFPSFGTTSSGIMPSSSDITYYRPVAGSDITHLISESRTQQALFPILRKYYSNAASTMNREKDNLGPASNLNPNVERVDTYTQFENLETNTAEDTVTQMTPTSVVSTGITPSPERKQEEEEVFMSECVLLNVDKENSSCQTHLAFPKLAFTGAKIMSISSNELSAKSKSQTVERALGSNIIVDFSSRAVGSNPAVANVPSIETTSSKCCCDCDDEQVSCCPTCQVVSCGTDPNIAAFNYTRSTSARGLDSYYETELLLSNLIKKALMGTNIGSHHALMSEKSNGSSRKSRYNINCVSTSTNTNVGLKTKAIGPTPSDMSKIIGMNRTDAEIQYMEQQLEKPGAGSGYFTSRLNQLTNESPTQTEGFEATPHRSASMMTSYCGLPAAIQVPAMSGMSVKEDVSRRSFAPYASASDMNFDIETNTNYQQGPVTDNLAQTSLVQTTQKSLEVKIFRNCGSKPVNSKAELRKSVNSQLLSLSHLIGKKRADPNLQMQDKWLNEFPSVDSGPHPKKFSNYSYDSRKVLLSDEENQKRKSCSFSLKTESQVHNPMRSHELPTLVISKDSLADVLPMLNSKNLFNSESKTEIALHSKMVDQITSDNYVTKDVKESILQASPESCDTGTESLPTTYSKKSACVLTTQCVLTPAPPCNGGQLFEPKSRACVFVYGEPRCVVHNSCVNAGIQHDPPADKEVNQKRECVTHSVGQLTSRCSLRDCQRSPSALIREVLSPKVYKALYETTKLVVSKETKQPSPRYSNVVAARVDAEVDAAKFDSPNLRSACVLTSDSVCGSKTCCPCDRGSLTRCKCSLQQAKVKKSEDSHGDSSLESRVDSVEGNEECCEVCMRRHLVTSCRYYSTLLTKQLDRVKQNLTKHLGAPSMEKIEQQPVSNSEACTMKPSGQNAFATQTVRHAPFYIPTRHMSCVLSPATSLTNICKYDKAHLKSVYYMLSAIEGRLRRMKLNSPSSYCQ